MLPPLRLFVFVFTLAPAYAVKIPASLFACLVHLYQSCIVVMGLMTSEALMNVRTVSQRAWSYSHAFCEGTQARSCKSHEHRAWSLPTPQHAIQGRCLEEGPFEASEAWLAFTHCRVQMCSTSHSTVFSALCLSLDILIFNHFILRIKVSTVMRGEALFSLSGCRWMVGR